MTDQNQGQDVALHDESEIMEMQGHDPANAEAQSVASLDAADEVTVQAAQPSQGTAVGNTMQDPMGMQAQTKAAMMAAMVDSLSKMNKKDVAAAYHSMMNGGGDAGAAEADSKMEDVQYKADFASDLNALVSEEATLSEGFKAKAETIFEAAINAKLSMEVDRLEEKYNQELAEELQVTKEDLVNKVDSYLNYVVEQWAEDNRLAIQNGLRTEIAEGFMGKLRDLFVESYVEVPESKVDLVDELAKEVEDLEEALNKQTTNTIAMQEELEVLYKDIIIREASYDLATTQVEKLNGLVEGIAFESVEQFADKVMTIKESYFPKVAAKSNYDTIEEDFSGDAEVVEGGSMDSYLSALKKTSK